MSYNAVVSHIKVRPHPNADNLQLGTCLGNQVVVGLDTPDGELGVFFGTDGQLSHEFCLANNLYTASARKKLGLDPTEYHGFFDHRRRVRAQRFRAEKSDGFWLPLSCLDWTGADPTVLTEGTQFSAFGGYDICQKYYTPATLRALGGQKLSRRDARCFPKHDDTRQLRFVVDDIPEDAVIYITEKLHGTSGRYGHIWDDLTLPRWKELLNHVYPLFADGHWTYLNGSRQVILEKSSGPGWYGTNEFRYDVVKDLTLHRGEILYFEIVGWVNETSPIMPPHDTTKTALTEIRKQYGNQIHYTYGCQPGEHRIYVYKIVNVNQDGIARELPYPQVVSRCRELGLPTVPLLFGPTTLGHLAHLYSCEGPEALRKTVDSLTEGASTLDPTQIREGVVVRIESSQGIAHLKNKQWAFGVLEGFWKEKDTNVDLEEIS